MHSGTEISSQIVNDLISKIVDLPLPLEENTENTEVVSQIIDELILNIEESPVTLEETPNTENQEMASQVTESVISKSEESALSFKEMDNPGNRVKHWKENTENNVTTGIDPDNIAEVMKLAQESLNLKNSEQFQPLTREIQNMPRNRDLHKFLEFQEGNTKNVVVFYCSKGSDGTVTIAYAIHSISYQMENAESEIDKEEGKTVIYQKQEAERSLRKLGFKVPNVPEVGSGSRLATPTDLTLSCESCGCSQDTDDTPSRTKAWPISLAWLIYECICKFMSLLFCRSKVNITEHCCIYCKAPLEWKETPSEQSPLLVTTE